MDRFRVQSLEKIYQDIVLSDAQKIDVLDELILKLSYLHGGSNSSWKRCRYLSGEIDALSQV